MNLNISFASHLPIIQTYVIMHVLVEADAVFVTCFPMFRSSIEGQILEGRGCTGVLISV